MNRKEDAKSFIWAALVLMAEGLVVRLLLGASPTRELLQFVVVVVAAFLAVLFFVISLGIACRRRKGTSGVF